MSTTITNLQRHLLDKLPTPIAIAWGKFLRAKNHSEKIRQGHATLDVFLRYTTGVVLSVYLRGEPSQQVEKIITNFQKPSIGHYTQLLLPMLRALQAQENDFCSFIIDWYLDVNGKVRESQHLLEKLIHSRNVDQHGYTPTEQELREDNFFFDEITRFFSQAKWLWGYRIFRSYLMRKSREGGFQGKILFYVGENIPLPDDGRLSEALYEETLYLSHPHGTCFLEMYPLLTFQEQENRHKVYIWKNIDKKSAIILWCGSSEEKVALNLAGTPCSWTDFLQRRTELEPLLQNRFTDGFVAKHFDYIGQQIQGRYQVQAVLGEGGFATVYQVFDELEQREKALKILHFEHIDSSHKERMKREFSKMKMSLHSNILRVYDFFESQELIAISMPLMKGSLKERLNEKTTQKQVEQWAVGLFDALKYLHMKSILHRDIKPSNILFDEQDNVFLADFGIAKFDFDSGSDLTTTGQQIGTRKYCAPEMHYEDHPHSFETDCFSLAFTLHEILQGRRPNPNKVGVGIEGDFGVFLQTLGSSDEPKKRLEARWPLEVAEEGEIQKKSTAIKKSPENKTNVRHTRTRIVHSMVEVPAGTFMMGALHSDWDADYDEKPQHEVTLTKGLLVSKYPCTQELYEKVMGENPSRYKDPTRPVENVSWCDAVLFCNKLSEMEGLEPAYILTAALEKACRNQSKTLDKRVDELSKQVTWNKVANGYRLPTEAEWEYCARGGASHLYSGSNNVNDVAWYKGNSDETHPVGQKKANGFGLHDMSGNVWEWVWDSWYRQYYQPITDPFLFESGAGPMCRGGAFNTGKKDMRVSFRSGGSASTRVKYKGFRVLRNHAQMQSVAVKSNDAEKSEPLSEDTHKTVKVLKNSKKKSDTNTLHHSDKDLEWLKQSHGSHLFKEHSPDERLLYDASLREEIGAALADLTPREELVFRMLYGYGETTQYSLEEIGNRLYLTSERIRQIELKAIKKVRSVLSKRDSS